MTRAVRGVVTPAALEAAARGAVPEGHLAAPGGAASLPLGSLSWAALVDLAGGVAPAGVVISAPLQVSATVAGASCPRVGVVRRGVACALTLLPGDRVETFGHRRTSVLVVPYVRDPAHPPQPWPSVPELVEPMPLPGKLAGSFTPAGMD